MRYRLYTLLISTFLCLLVNAQTNISTWQFYLDAIEMSKQELQELCPNFPEFEKFNTNVVFSEAVKKWENDFPNEKRKLFESEKAQKINMSLSSLGLTYEEPKKLENSLLQWITSSGISNERLNELAPHFPKPNLSNSNLDDEKIKYDNAIEKWNAIYPIELENLINAPELIALNPYYEKYVVVAAMPRFYGANISRDKPLKPTDFKSIEEEIKYELAIQNWYFVFAYEEFEQKFGYVPRFPLDFDVEKYRNDVIRSIRERQTTENQ